jgi:hypothetical protein
MESSEQPVVLAESPQHLSQRRFTSHAKTEAVLRVLKGDSLETVSQELGISVRRLERWRSSFVAAGSAELAKRKEVSSKGWAGTHSISIQQWVWLLLALVGIVGMLVLYVQSGPQE